MGLRTQLASNLRSESKAYGYTLSVWGVGALLIYRYGTPTPLQVGTYIGGALLAVAVLVAVAFDEVFTVEDSSDDSGFVVASAVHVLATGGNVLLAYCCLLVLPTRPEWFGFAVEGLVVTFGYNALLLPESHAVRRLVARRSQQETSD